MMSWNVVYGLKECVMKIDFGPSSFNLPRDGVVVLREATGARVVCVTGALWLTQEGREEDVVLAAGESLRVSNGGVTVVTGLRGSEVLVVQPRASGREVLRRLRALIPGSLSRMLPSM
jgi:hypothetical protein